MNTQDLIAGYAAYTDAAELVLASSEEAPAFTPSSTATVTVPLTLANGC